MANSQRPLVLVPDDPLLIRVSHDNVGVVEIDNALAAKPALQTGVDGAVNEVLFLVRNFLQKIFPAFNIDMASGAGAHAPAVVVEVYVVFLGKFQYGLILKVSADGFFRYG